MAGCVVGWVKVYGDLLSDSTVQGWTPSQRYCWVGTLLVAGQARWPGELTDAAGDAISSRALADLLNVSRPALAAFLDRALSSGKLVQRVDGIIEVKNWRKRQNGVAANLPGWQRNARKSEGNAATPTRARKTGGNKGLKPTTAIAVVQEVHPHKIWDALVEALGEPQTRSEKSRRGMVVKELHEAGAEPQDVLDRVRQYRRRWPDMAMTDTALAKHWSSLAPKRRPSPPCPECGVAGPQHAADCPVVAPFTDADLERVGAAIRGRR